MSKVYITNKSSHNYNDAKRFGELIALTYGNLDLSNTSKLVRQMSSEIDSSLPADYILLSGASTANVVACSLFVAKHGKLNLLIYRRNGTYVERNLCFGNNHNKEHVS